MTFPDRRNDAYRSRFFSRPAIPVTVPSVVSCGAESNGEFHVAQLGSIWRRRRGRCIAHGETIERKERGEKTKMEEKKTCRKKRKEERRRVGQNCIKSTGSGPIEVAGDPPKRSAMFRKQWFLSADAQPASGREFVARMWPAGRSNRSPRARFGAVASAARAHRPPARRASPGPDLHRLARSSISLSALPRSSVP